MTELLDAENVTKTDIGYCVYKNDYFSLWAESNNIIDTPEFKRDPYFIIYDNIDKESSTRSSKISFYRNEYIGLKNTYRLNRQERDSLCISLRTTYANSRYNFNQDQSIFGVLANKSGIKSLSVLDIPNYKVLM